MLYYLRTSTFLQPRLLFKQISWYYAYCCCFPIFSPQKIPLPLTFTNRVWRRQWHCRLKLKWGSKTFWSSQTQLLTTLLKTSWLVQGNNLANNHYGSIPNSFGPYNISNSWYCFPWKLLKCMDWVDCTQVPVVPSIVIAVIFLFCLLSSSNQRSKHRNLFSSSLQGDLVTRSQV